ncbi:MAG: GTP pyrophosphokinase [Accumulibacter sp.]|uniref:HD domain-containing protein n=1 Tax=Accumulibacter sp. TaxID=2053492 RepID=UPI00121ADCE6|nr:HD domain-containing protein [Accumulibacter sp.]QKS29337.1 MAG: bifunctional (p)ppGpp synthetase/guanosine-3',5'-bis(diphosphate) 3'-pyrophosphohydrolase [Candidatus Accumulibacter similis]TLD45729.1 MAG: GTP pyrophosphokinase [Accumulibacter sp.]
MLDEARAFAFRAHSGQMYGTRPYSWHLEAVAELLAPYGVQAQVIGYLHDVVEDTVVSEDDVHARFGPFIGECVGLLTDAPAPTRAERKARTHARLARVGSGPAELALVVKAADRLANVRSCVADDRQVLWHTYRREHPAFREAVYRAGLCDPLWRELDMLLAPAQLATSDD